MPIRLTAHPDMAPMAAACRCWHVGRQVTSPMRCSACVAACVLADWVEGTIGHTDAGDQLADAVDAAAAWDARWNPEIVLDELARIVGQVVGGYLEELLAVRAVYAAQRRRDLLEARPPLSERAWTLALAIRAQDRVAVVA